MSEMWDNISGYIIQYAFNVLAAIAILILGKWIARVLTRIIEKALLKSKINKTLASFAKNIVYYGLLVFVFIAALNKIGVETSSFIALIGAAGLAVGLALQGTLANFGAGVMMIIFEPFQVGDIVDAGGAQGKV